MGTWRGAQALLRPPHLTGPGMVVRPGYTEAGALLPALGAQQQLALAALDGSLPKADAGTTDTTWLRADHLETETGSGPPPSSRYPVPLLYLLPARSHCLYPFPLQAELRHWGMKDSLAPHPMALSPAHLPRRERGWVTHCFGGELVLDWWEALWRRGEGGWFWLPH